jgi:hypothetical protein
MKRTYKNNAPEDVSYFIGNEVEKTPFYGRKTLFVVGLKNPRKIIKKANDNLIRHIYLGANMSFKNTVWAEDKTSKLREILDALLNERFQVTLDISKSFDLSTIDMFVENEYFHIMYSLPIPNAEKYAKAITVKIDDIGFNKTNTGVWCSPLEKFMDPVVKTEWDAYKTDEVIE